ncbi:hypothetical protein [Spirillospora sp. NPDC029432]|uniref:hypothetical protein n=1 Tax=Spirillospora sp. NPDC029432 TaxID=3154599 RepID=UPI003451D7DF
MNDELETLLREHYRRGADRIGPDAELLHRLRNAADPATPRPRARPGRPWLRAGLWAVPVLAAAAAVLAFALLGSGERREERPAPLVPAPSLTVPVPTPTGPSPVPRPTPPGQDPRGGSLPPAGPAPTSAPSGPSAPVPSRTPG